MTTCPSLTPAQRAAAKPWGIAYFSLWAAEMLSIFGLGILLIKGVPIGLRVAILWVGATFIGKRLLQMFCTRRLERIVGADWGPSARSEWSWLAIEIAVFTVAIVVISV